MKWALLKLGFVILLVVAISLQISVREIAKVHLDQLVHTRSIALNDFLTSSEQRAAAEGLGDTQSSDRSDPKNANFAHVVKSTGDLLDTEILNIKSLSCIDVVERCAEFTNESLPSTIDIPESEQKTLALAAPMLKGGYRNQYMRFVALVGNALINRQNILLPSIKWHEKGGHNSVPFEMLFDVEEWNRHQSLPKLVNFNESIHHQWNSKSTVFMGSCNNVIKYFHKPHRTSILNGLKGVTQPFALGGAISGQPGNLWDFYRLRDKGSLTFDTTEASLTLHELEEWVLSAMKPSPLVVKIVNSIRPQNQPYIALHPRIEPEMMEHAHCKEKKVRSMPKILEQVISYEGFENYTSMFVAVAMPQMTVPHHVHPRYPFSKEHKENLETLISMFDEGIDRPKNSHIHVWTAGESSLEERKVNSCMIQLLASIINMELALEADVFVGTSVSTWSNSVWKIRHWRGMPNYEFTHNGIKQVEGLPPPFVC